MLLRVTIVLVLLQLHASSTLTDNGKEQNVSTRKMKRFRRTVGSVQHKRTSQEPLRSISLQDEDLLDLMVRIAQSPSEWERIQQVLSQLGTRNKPEDSVQNEEVLSKLDVNINGSKNSDRSSNPDLNSSTLNSSSKISLPLNNINSKNDEKTAQKRISTETTRDSDSGWPDFEEAILKKVRKQESKSDTNLQRSLYENDWFDTSWSDLLDEEEKDEESQFENSNLDSAAVSFVKLNVSDGSSYRRSKHSRKTYSASNMFEVSSRVNLPTQNEDYVEDMSNRSSRPVFTYHRVTTNPQERKSNSAIIAVSVARREQENSLPDTSKKQTAHRIQANLEDSFKRNFERHRSKERKESLTKPDTPGHLRHHTHSHH